MNRFFSLSAGAGSRLRRGLAAGLLGALMAWACVPAWANADDDYTERLVTEFAPWVGSPQDTEVLVQSLRSGHATGPSGPASVAPATGALAYGEARLALKLAQGTLAQEGVTQPTAAQLQAALHGGALETASGPKILPGVLPQRAGGQSWGAMAQGAGLSVEDLIPPRSAAQHKVAGGKGHKKGAKAGHKSSGKKAAAHAAKTSKTTKAAAAKKSKPAASKKAQK